MDHHWLIFSGLARRLKVLINVTLDQLLVVLQLIPFDLSIEMTRLGAMEESRTISFENIGLEGKRTHRVTPGCPFMKASTNDLYRANREFLEIIVIENLEAVFDDYSRRCDKECRSASPLS